MQQIMNNNNNNIEQNNTAFESNNESQLQHTAHSNPTKHTMMNVLDTVNIRNDNNEHMNNNNNQQIPLPSTDALPSNQTQHRYKERSVRSSSHRSQSRSRSRSRSRDRNKNETNQSLSRSQQREALKQSELSNIPKKADSYDIETQAKAIGLDYFTLKQIAMTDEQIMNLIQVKQKEEIMVVKTENEYSPTVEQLPAQTMIESTNDNTIAKAKEELEDTDSIIMPKSHPIDLNNANADKDILGATELAGKNNDKIPLPTDAKEEFSVFVGDLHHLVTRKDLLSVFGKVGDVIWIQLFDCHAQLNRPFNFAFIYYTNMSDATKCIDQLNFTKFYGNPCRVMLKSKNQLEWTNCNLIVKNLPPNTNSQMLYTLFEPYGTITSSKVKTTNTGRTLPYGYVQFNSYQAAQKALTAAQNKEIKLGENTISAEWFKSRDDRPNKQIFIKNIPAAWDEKKIIEFVQECTKFNIASISTKGSPYGKWACVAFYEFQQAQTAIRILDGIETSDYIHPKLSVSKFMNKSDRDNHHNHREHNHHHHHHHHREHNRDHYHRDRDRRDHNNYHNGGAPINRHNNRGANMNWNAAGFNNNNFGAQTQNRNFMNYGNRNFNNNNNYSAAAAAGGNMNAMRGHIGGSAFGMFSLYVGNIPHAITETHLQQIFESFGKIRTCHILEKTVDFRYGFVNFAYAEDAARALVSMNGKKVGDKCLQVKPTQKDGDKARQIEYYACVMQQNQSQFTGGNNVNGYNNNNNMAQYGQRSRVVPFVPPAHVTPQAPQMPYDRRGNTLNTGGYETGVNVMERVNPAALAIDEAERILCTEQHVIVWKVQYGDEWHEYNTQLAALTEQLQIGCKTTITLSDSDYLLTKIDEKQALQQNLTTGTTRKVVRLFRSKR